MAFSNPHIFSEPPGYSIQKLHIFFESRHRWLSVAIKHSPQDTIGSTATLSPQHTLHVFPISATVRQFMTNNLGNFYNRGDAHDGKSAYRFHILHTHRFQKYISGSNFRRAFFNSQIALRSKQSAFITQLLSISEGSLQFIFLNIEPSLN